MLLSRRFSSSVMCIPACAHTGTPAYPTAYYCTVRDADGRGRRSCAMHVGPYAGLSLRVSERAETRHVCACFLTDANTAATVALRLGHGWCAVPLCIGTPSFDPAYNLRPQFVAA
jgi:hypothetical protein